MLLVSSVFLVLVNSPGADNMVKRRASSDEGEFEDFVEGSPASKRSRVEEEPEEDAKSQPEQRNVDSNENGNEEGEDTEFEAKYADVIRKSIESKSKNHGVRTFCLASDCFTDSNV